ncbi:hypothetical protein YC2023_103099 [Brassica napus]
MSERERSNTNETTEAERNERIQSLNSPLLHPSLIGPSMGLRKLNRAFMEIQKMAIGGSCSLKTSSENESLSHHANNPNPICHTTLKNYYSKT